MTYPSLMSDEQDDWERQRREAEQLAMLLPDDERMPSPMQLPPPHDPIEMAPVQVDNGPDWTDALGVGTTALASLVDLAANHGRGVGQILSSGGAYGAARAGQRLQQTQDALTHEEKRAALERSNRYDDLQYALLAGRMQKQQPGGGVSDYQRSQLDAREQDRQDRLAAAKGADEDRDAARADRNQQFTLSMEDRKAAREAAEAERAERNADRQQTQADRATEKKAVADDKTTREFAKDTETSRSMAHQLQELDPILKKYEGDDIPGTGKVDRFIPNWAQDYLGSSSEDATRIDQLKTGVQAEYRHAKTGAAASVPEDLRLMIVNGTRPDSTEQEFRLGMEALKKAIPLQIKAYGANREDQARAVLREQGLEGFVYGASAPPSAAALPTDRTSGPVSDGYAGDLPTNLGVTAPPGVRNTPDFPGGAQVSRLGNGRQQAAQAPVGGQAAGGMVNGPAMGDGVIMRSPSGNVGPVPPDKVAAAIAAGWKRVQ